MNFNIQRALVLLCSAGFILSAVTGLWAAFDRQMALWRFTLLLGSLALVLLAEVLPSHRRQQSAPLVALFCLVLTYSIGIAYLAHSNFRVGVLSGAVGSSLAVLLPLSIGATSWIVNRSSRLTLVGTLLALCVIFLALGVTRERTAWLSMLLGGLFALGIGWLTPAHSRQRRRRADYEGRSGLPRPQVVSSFPSTAQLRWRPRLVSPEPVLLLGIPQITIALLVAMIVGYLLLFWPWAEAQLVSGLPVALQAEIAERLVLWHNTLALISDYPFTGSGLAGLQMTLASYVYLSHTPVQRHAHQLFLQIAGEQGWLGCISYVGLLLVAIVCTAKSTRSPRREWRGLRLGMLATLLSLLIYGLVDGEVYAYATVPVTFLPIACALLLRVANEQDSPDWAMQPIPEYGDWAQTFAMTVTVSLLSAMVILSWLNWDGLRAALWANWGAVAQSRAELSVYHWPEWGIQDALRRSDGVPLESALHDFQRSLRLNPNNETALRRLGQIALAQGRYSEAKQILQEALSVAPDHYATRLLLGELYALENQPEKAVELWRTIPLLNGQLDGRYWWYYHLNAQSEADSLYKAMFLLKAVD